MIFENNSGTNCMWIIYEGRFKRERSVLDVFQTAPGYLLSRWFWDNYYYSYLSESTGLTYAARSDLILIVITATRNVPSEERMNGAASIPI